MPDCYLDGVGKWRCLVCFVLAPCPLHMKPSTRPARIQRRRTKGWTMPKGAIYVGRPTAFGNPYRVGVNGSAARCVELYRESLKIQRAFRRWVRRDLRGKNLVCWCPLGQPCHADVLLELANG